MEFRNTLLMFPGDEKAHVFFTQIFYNLSGRKVAFTDLIQKTFTIYLKEISVK